jgi:adenylate cyclase
LVVLYRIFLGYYAGLRVFLFAAVAYTCFAALELSGAVPVGPLLATPVHHPMWTDVRLGVVVIVAVWVILFAAFILANYGMNQQMRLHRYMTESVLYRYLPPTLVRRAAAGELTLDAPPERRVVTVMFTDVVGFTALTERLGPDAIGQMLNTFLAEVADVAHAHGATIDKFIGDCVMIMYGAPEEVEPEDQARRCVALALAIHSRIQGLDFGHPIDARTGINTGEAVVGNFGSRARSDYTALGPAVNIASRLENKCRTGGILIGAATAELLGEEVIVEPTGPMDLKGVKDPIEAYYVDIERSALNPDVS